MTAAWPPTLPALSDDHPYQETPQPAVLQFKPEVGTPISRPQSTVQLSTATFAFVMTDEQAQIFETFVREDLAKGALPFTIQHPRTLQIVTVYLDGQAPYRIASFAPGAWSVTFTGLVRE
jgi:hypothetical protein